MTDAYTDTEYSAAMPVALAERRGFVIRKMLLKFGTGGLKMTINEAIKICEEDAEKIGGNPQSDRHAERCRQLAEWLTDYKELKNTIGAVKLSNMKEAKNIIRECNRVLGYLLECEIESTSTRHKVETLLKSITEYLSGGGENEP